MRSGSGLQSVPRIDPAANIVACALTDVQRARLSGALRGRAALRIVDTFDQLSAMLRGTIEDIGAVLLAPRDRAGHDAVRIIREIAAERPKTAIIVYCEAARGEYAIDFRVFAAAGAHQFVFTGIEDISGVTIRSVVEAAERQCAADWVLAQLAPLVPATLLPFAEAMLRQPDEVTDVRTLGNAVRLHRKTLYNRCKMASFLTPTKLLIWVRLALAAYLLETTGCTVEQLAIQLAYPSDTALRNMMKRYTGKRPTEVRAAGGLACVLEAMRRRLDRAETFGRLRRKR